MSLISRITRLPFVYQLVINQPVFRDFLLESVQNFVSSTKSKLTNYPQETLDQSAKMGKVATYQFTNYPGFIREFTGTIVAYSLTGLYDKFKKWDNKIEMYWLFGVIVIR